MAEEKSAPKKEKPAKVAAEGAAAAPAEKKARAPKAPATGEKPAVAGATAPDAAPAPAAEQKPVEMVSRFHLVRQDWVNFSTLVVLGLDHCNY